ncbi:MAG TPA: hypothetical protein ENL02_00845 [Epsilonproteobacteria bacterium]|nr:hypothetical protein [Campylobacterota bacterium]
MEPILIDTEQNVVYYDFPDWCDDTKFILKNGMEITYTKRYVDDGSTFDMILICDRSLYCDADVIAYCQQFHTDPIMKRNTHGVR